MTTAVPMPFVAKAAALLVFLAAIGGATYAVQLQLGGAEALAGASFRADAVHPRLNATPAHAVTFAVLVQNRGDEPVDVVARLAGEGLEGASRPVRVPAQGNMTLFVPVDVPAAATTGDQPLALSLEVGGRVVREKPDAATLRVLGDAPGFGDGVTANIVYVGRLSNGAVFNTNDPAILPLNFSKTASYQASTGGAFTVTGGPDAGVVQGFYDILVGMQAGESRTVTVPADQAYGPRAIDSEIPRTESLERSFSLPVRTDSVPRATFDGYVQETRQGSVWDVGDVFFFEQGANRWPYRIESMDASNVGYRLAVEEGQAFTLYPFWTNASIVETVNATAATFRTTPTTTVGGTLTMRSYWPQMTTLVSVTDDEIIVRHDPPVGFKYTQPASQLQPASDATVKEVRDDVIVVATPSDNPLAGEDLTFDVRVTSLRT